MEVSLTSVISSLSSIAMIFGGVIPYVPQYLEIRRTQNAEGFSLFVCLALLVANILRILFWFGKPFETPLLIQSILMNIAMLMMIHLCVRVKAKSARKKKSRVFTDDQGKTVSSHIFRDFDRNYFWNWTDFQSYMECLLIISTIGGLLMYQFANFPPFVETVGFLAVFTEAMLGVPQFLRNFRNKSTRGMNASMVFMWTAGDIFKTTYFILRNAPIQFAICGCLQISVDLAILAQIVIYGDGKGTANE